MASNRTEVALFEDPEFPASNSSILSHGLGPLYHLISRINWLRPQEVSAYPRLFPDDQREGQVKQGVLGDCWFLCACAVLQDNRQLLDKVLPFDQPLWTSCSYTGQFVCRFWQFGTWVEVTIDDRLPCIGGKLCFSRCRSEDVFWLPLIEKAYAKLHMCYEELWAGKVADALVDITGGIVERWILGDTRSEAVMHKTGDVITNVPLKNLLEQKCFVSCSVYSPYEGSSNMTEYHAFNITELKDVPLVNSMTVRLIRIWNPWGRRCWNGRWTEGGEGWTHVDPVYASELQANTEDGEFWVEEKEFLKEFSEVTASYPVSEDGHIQSFMTGKQLPHTKQATGSWVKGQSAGGCRNNSSFPVNPKFWLRLWEHCEVLITLMQKPKQVMFDSIADLPESMPSLGYSSQARLPYKSCNRDCRKAIGLHMWKVVKRKFSLEKTLASPTTFSTSSHAYEREVQLHCSLAPGYYLIVASTFLKDEEGDFLLRVFSSGTMSLGAMKMTSSSIAWLDDHPQGEWKTSQLSGRWVLGLSSGGCRNFPTYHTNPRFVLSVCADVGSKNVKVTLHQKCTDQEFHAIGFHIYQFSGSNTEDVQSVPLQCLEPVVCCVPHRSAQEVSQLCTLPPGNYFIVPSTYQPNIEGDFTLTITTKINRKPVQCEETLETILQEVSSLSLMRQDNEESRNYEK